MMDSDADDDYFVPISALQHMLYCPRQCALIHVEQQWVESQQTAEGRVLHTRVDAGGHRTARDVRVERSVHLRSTKLGLVGVADVVELRKGGVVYPVEYKRGRPKRHRADEVQLCAQAMCLEEMSNIEIVEGALFYGQRRSRTAIEFDSELRTLTIETALATRRMLIGTEIPSAEYSHRKCGKCSLIDVCRPRMAYNRKVSRWLAAAIGEPLNP